MSDIVSFPKHVSQRAVAANFDRALTTFRTTLHDEFRNAVINHGRANGTPQDRIDERLVAIEGMLARAEQTPGVTLILQEATLDQVNDAVREAAFKWWLHAMLTILDALPAILGSTPYGRQK